MKIKDYKFDWHKALCAGEPRSPFKVMQKLGFNITHCVPVPGTVCIVVRINNADQIQELPEYIDELDEPFYGFEEARMKTDKKVLDPCCGSRMFWFDKKNPKVMFCDNRELHTTLCDGRRLDIEPDMVCDFTDLPFEDNSFWHVVFDPPHMKTLGEGSWMAKKYGTLKGIDWKPLIRDGFKECMRVLKPNGTLIFKWNEQDIPVKEILNVIGSTPMYGHKSGKLQKTHWMAFLKDETDGG